MRLSQIAYVDDEPDLREVVQLALCLMAQATVHCFESGAHALRELPSLRPDLVLLDVMMPAMDGTEVIRRMRDDRVLRDIPVIFMTAKVMPDEVARLRALGAIGVIAKPFDPTLLAEEVLGHWQAVAAASNAEQKIADLADSLATRFARRTLAELPGIRDSCAQLLRGNEAALQPLQRWTHKVRGTAASIGLADVSARVGEIEGLLISGAASSASTVEQERLATLLASLEAQLRPGGDSRE